MLIRINKHTWVRPKSTRIALITNAQSDEQRRIWIVCPGTFDEPIEVTHPYHAELLRALEVDLGRMKDAV